MQRTMIWIFLLLLFAASFASAGKGGIQVSAITVDCGDEDKEGDVLESGAGARIWINVPAGTNTDGISYTITDQSNPVVNATNLTVTACGDGYFYGDITLPAAEGTFTLTVTQADGTNLGSDTFQLKPAAK